MTAEDFKAAITNGETEAVAQQKINSQQKQTFRQKLAEKIRAIDKIQSFKERIPKEQKQNKNFVRSNVGARWIGKSVQGITPRVRNVGAGVRSLQPRLQLMNSRQVSRGALQEGYDRANSEASFVGNTQNQFRENSPKYGEWFAGGHGFLSNGKPMDIWSGWGKTEATPNHPFLANSTTKQRRRGTDSIFGDGLFL